MIKVLTGHVAKRAADWSYLNSYPKQEYEATTEKDPMRNLKIHLELVMVSDDSSGRERGLSNIAGNQFITVILIVIGVLVAVKLLQLACGWCIRNKEKAANAEICRQQSEDEQQQLSSVLTSPIAREDAAPAHRVSIPNEIPTLFNGKKVEEGEWEGESTDDSQAGIEVNQDQYLEILGGTEVFETTNKDWELGYGDLDTKQIIKQ